jgi:formamidopyrimidine-DNA glycosylase
MVTNITTKDITMEEAIMLDDTHKDFSLHGKTDVKCPRCGNPIVMIERNTSYVIGCENGDLSSVYRGI